jgi:hypothetical protein
LRDTLHEPLAARVPAERLTDPEPDVAATVPPQVLLTLGVAATTRPAGRLSANARPLRARAAFGLVMLKLSDVVPFKGIEAAPKVLVMLGGVATVRVAEAVLPVPPLVELTAPVVLVN